MGIPRTNPDHVHTLLKGLLPRKEIDHILAMMKNGHASVFRSPHWYYIDTDSLGIEIRVVAVGGPRRLYFHARHGEWAAVLAAFLMIKSPFQKHIDRIGSCFTIL